MAGDIADMMLDGTMDPETGEWNFDGEDGPGWPMTGEEAAEFKRTTRRFSARPEGPETYDEPPREGNPRQCLHCLRWCSSGRKLKTHLFHQHKLKTTKDRR